MIDSRPFRDFEQAAKAALSHLRERLGYQLFMVTRTEGDDWIVLHSEDHGYGVESGAVLRWSDSFCARMVAGEAPCVAPRADDVPAFSAAGIRQQFEIGAYIGVPLSRADGTLFGTLCGIDPAPQETPSPADQALVELLARMLSTVLQQELLVVEHSRSIERLEKESAIDALTGLANRRGWHETLKHEEARARRVGSPTCVFVIDLDDLKQINDTHGHAAGDKLLQRVAERIRSTLREQDSAARVGGDEFTILATECAPAAAETLFERLESVFEEAGIAASIGRAMRDPASGLIQAWRQADQAMYRRKRAGRGRVRQRQSTAIR